MILATLNTLN